MMKLIVGFALFSAVGVGARSWSEIVSPTVLSPVDARAVNYLVVTDPFFENKVLVDPSTTPPPTQFPTMEPTMAPTTRSPTFYPTETPTTSPTESPTPPPDPYPPNKPPKDPKAWYFNYNMTQESPYGPGELGLIQHNGNFRVGLKNNNWGSVSNPPNFYWKEFTDEGWGPWKGVLENRDVARNMCEKGNMQSPIDVKQNGAVCHEHHEVRSLVST